MNTLVKKPRCSEPRLLNIGNSLAADLGAWKRVSAYLRSPEAVACAAQDPLQGLSQLSVAFSSLTDSALRQVKRILEDRYPGVRVSLNSDLVGTTRLKQLAKQAYLFVVATASAKPAFYSIRDVVVVSPYLMDEERLAAYLHGATDN